MSAPRPRPVTATVSRQERKVTYRASSVTAISSGSSTESLVSDVKLCGSLSSESSSTSGKDTPHQLAVGHAADNGTTRASSLAQSTPRPDSQASRSDSRGSGLSAWESWLLEKAKRERKIQKLKAQKQEQALQADQEADKTKAEKLSKVERTLAEWRAKKDAEQQQRQAALERKQAVAMAAKQEKEKQIQEQAGEKFKNWLEHKQEEERTRKDAENKARQLQALELEKKRRLGDEAFHKWINEVSSRPHPTAQSKGSANSAGSGRHNNFDAYPKPTFCNPIAWQPVCTLSSEPGARKKGSPRGASGKKKAKRNPWSVDNV